MTWNPESMAIKCFCHIIQLIVNAGLNVLGIPMCGPRSIKTATLAHFPDIKVLPTISEEDEEAED